MIQALRPFCNLKTVSEIFLKPFKNVKQQDFLTELWHLLDVSAVVGHGGVLAVLLL